MKYLYFNIINKFGYIGILFLLILENVFPPIPSEIILCFSGYYISKYNKSIVLLIIFSCLGSLIGSLLLYYIGFLFSDHYKKYIKYLDNKKNIYILIARFIPFIRSIISIPCGIKRINIFIFILYTTLGSLIWNLLIIITGIIIGSKYYLISYYIKKYILVLCILFIIYLIHRLFKQCIK